MIKNYFSVAIRYLNKNKFYSGLNILGLSIGIACSLVILSYVRYEFSHDAWNDNLSRIVRITETINDDAGNPIHFASSPAPVATALETSINDIDKIGRLFPHECFITKDGVERFIERKFVFADSTITSIFSFEALYGDPTNALKQPFGLIVTESTAIRYFGITNVVGQALTYEAESAKQDFYIAAVIRDVPDNSHFEFDFLASFHSLETFMPWYNNWYWPPMYTYALTSATTDLVKLHNDVNNQMQQSLPNWEKDNRSYSVQQLGDIHLRSNLENEWKSNNRYEYVMIFWVIAIFILAIACINFINLATSKSIQRGREVGIRKVMGASRGRLVIQYLGESFLTTLISFLIAFGLTEWVLLVLFKRIAGIQLGLDYLMLWPNWFYLGLSILVIAFLAGFYPALILSRFKPAVILGSKSATVKESSNLRKGLVIFQFAISGFLIIGTFVVLNQVNFLQNKNLGFEKDLIVALKLNNREDQQNVTKLKNQLLAYNFIDGVTVCSQLPVEGSPYDNPVEPENSNKEGGYNLYTLAVDRDFTNVFKMDIVEGRTFSVENEADKTSSILINQAAVKRFGWKQGDATGRNVKLTWFSDSAEVRDSRVIGVLKNFHFNTLHHQIEPLILYVNSHIYYTSYVAVRFSESQITSAVDFLNSEWKKYSPDRPADIQFLNDELAKKYISEARVSKILSAFTLLAIVISCLGLLGLSAYSAEVRTKEIGIRKVLGASMSNILGMLSKEFMVLIFISNLIALPIGWIVARTWLQSFAYKAPLSTDIFLLAPFIGILIAFITVCMQSISAAISNPIKALRDE